MASASVLLSATDLVGHLNCPHLTQLDREVASGIREKPANWSPLLDLLWERGARHEQAYIERLEATGADCLRIEGFDVSDHAVAETLEAMRAGREVIIQGALRSGRWHGRADILLRVERPSDLGAWSYEPLDTKLARETRGGSVLQLCLYAHLLEALQGVLPESGYIVSPGSVEAPAAFRINDYAAFFRQSQQAFEQVMADDGEVATYPHPVTHCETCRWQSPCDQRRRADDHPSLIAGISALQIAELASRGFDTVERVAGMPLPLDWRPERGSRQSYERVREQARIQVAGRAAAGLLYELLPVEPGLGLTRLPAPSAGDVFFDLEGDPFVGEGGLEYLFGHAWQEAGEVRYDSQWVENRADEKAAFEGFVDFLIARLETWPDLHVYHFAPYEPGALKRLMGRYASREEEVDRLLRSQVFVDLYGVVKQSLRASVESYSIKRLEPLYGFERTVSLHTANQALAKVQACLELDDAATISDDDRGVVTAYNRDDCVSTLRLRDWLEDRRSELVASGAEVPRPEPVDGAAPESVAAWLALITPVMDRLLDGVPAGPEDRSAEQHGRWLLAQMLDWHRREEKAVWWEFFRLADLAAEELLEDRAGFSGLRLIETVGGTAKCPIHRYAFPPQEIAVRGDEDVRAEGGAQVGKIVGLSVEEGWIEIKKRADAAEVHPEAVFVHGFVGAAEMKESLLRLGRHVAEHGLQGDGLYRAARALLLRERLPGQDGSIRREGESVLDTALRLAAELPPGVLPIQGPPGAGKTYTGSRMIAALVAAGQTVGITANSHKVIRNLLDKVVEAAEERGLDVRCVQKPKEMEEDQPRLRFVRDNPSLFAAIGPDCPVAGGTAWLWSRPEAFECVDVLFVDEAAQMSLANVLAVAQAARTVVLLGDPQQLDQPMQGAHPEGSDVSALHHLLDGAKTITPDQGLFLDQTWRMHPDICAFTSEMFYEDRLHPRDNLDRQTIRAGGRLTGSGLRFVSVPHVGNQNASREEAVVIAELIAELLATGAQFTDEEGDVRPLTAADIMVITPYNAQVAELRDRLPDAHIGTVDKFQGQEAPVVFYSMATSSEAEAPRGMEFLYSLNRLNVATSRAKALCILVASPSLVGAECRTPRQMQLVNALCRYLELAQPI